MEDMTVMFNQFDIEKSNIDFNKINQMYDFYLIKNEKKDFTTNAKIFDDVAFDDRIMAIQYTYGASFIIMLKKDLTNKKLMSDFIKKHNSENDDSLLLTKLSVPFIKFPHSLIQIMFNAIAKDNKKANFSNLCGKLYYFSSRTDTQVFCVEIQICENYVIKLNNVTFTNKENVHDKKSYGKKEYVLNKNNTMRLKTSKDKTGPFYIMHQYKNTKHITPFVSILQGRFEESKMGVFNRVLSTFNTKYKEIVNLVMKKEDNWNLKEVKNIESSKKDHFKILKDLLENKTINIVNSIKDKKYTEASKNFCMELKKQIKDFFTSSKYFDADNLKLNFKISISKTVKKDCLNIMLIHNEDYYKENKKEKDPYKKNYNSVIQHITLEDFSKGKSMDKPKDKLCVVLINELIIKNDLLFEKQISIKKWKEYNFKNDFIFCDCNEIYEGEKKDKKLIGKDFIFMIVHPNGTFEMEKISNEKDCHLIDLGIYKKLEETFRKNDKTVENHNKYNQKYREAVINDKGEINIIKDTEFEMYPNFEKIGNNIGHVGRGKNDRNEYFLGTLDINYKNYGDYALYSVGEIGNGMDRTMARASCIRKIESLDGAPIYWYSLLDTMNVIFIRHGRLTVLPFPFKYIREFYKNIKI